jgi:hypothetical protein
LESMELLAGQSVGLVNDIKPAGEIVRGMVEEAERIIESWRDTPLRLHRPCADSRHHSSKSLRTS